MPREASKRRLVLQWVLRLLGPVLLLVVLARLPKPHAVWDLLRSAEPLTLGAALLLNLPAIHLKVVRWQYILRARGIEYDTKRAWVAFASSLYLAILTPGRVGDVLRIQYLKHDTQTPYAEGLASVVVDRLCDLYVLVGFVAAATVHYSNVVVGELRWVSWGAVVATALGPLVFFVPGLPEKLFSGIYRRLARDTDAKGLTVFLAALRANVGRALLFTIPLTVVSFLLGFFQGWLVSRSLGLDLRYIDVMSLFAVASLMGLLPISISGVGIREAFFAVVFPSLGYDASAAVGYGLLVFVVVYLSLAAIGFIAWQVRPPPAAAQGAGGMS